MQNPKIVNVDGIEIPFLITTTSTKATQVIGKQGLVQIKKSRDDHRTLRAIITEHTDVILNTFNKMTKKAVFDRSEKEYLQLCDKYINQFSEELHVTPTKVEQRYILIDTFGMTKKNGTIVLNAYMRFMNEDIIENCIYHEMCHIYTWKNYNTMKHDKDFYNMLYKKYTKEENEAIVR